MNKSTFQFLTILAIFINIFVGLTNFYSAPILSSLNISVAVALLYVGLIRNGDFNE